MYCSRCGRRLTGREARCPQCGNMKGLGRAPGAPVYATFGRRAAAFFIDTGILLTAAMSLAMIVTIVTGQVENPSLGLEGFLQCTLFSMQWLYYALMESSSLQASVGKLAMRIRVTDLGGRRITFWKATERYFAKIFSGLILLMGYVMAAFTKKRQALHDIIAGTLVLAR